GPRISMLDNTSTRETVAPAQTPASDSYSVNAALHPNKVALICGERSLTYAELNARANRVANELKSLGVMAGDRVAIMTYNSLEGLEVAAGLSKLGAIQVPINYR